MYYKVYIVENLELFLQVRDLRLFCDPVLELYKTTLLHSSISQLEKILSRLSLLKQLVYNADKYGRCGQPPATLESQVLKHKNTSKFKHINQGCVVNAIASKQSVGLQRVCAMVFNSFPALSQ